jgi:hypothetical protein
MWRVKHRLDDGRGANNTIILVYHGKVVAEKYFTISGAVRRRPMLNL